MRCGASGSPTDGPRSPTDTFVELCYFRKYNRLLPLGMTCRQVEVVRGRFGADRSPSALVVVWATRGRMICCLLTLYNCRLPRDSCPVETVS